MLLKMSCHNTKWCHNPEELDLNLHHSYFLHHLNNVFNTLCVIKNGICFKSCHSLANHNITVTAHQLQVCACDLNSESVLKPV